MGKLRNFNSNNNKLKHRLDLNETEGIKLQSLSGIFNNEFKNISKYPDPDSTLLKSKLVDLFKICPTQLLISNGVDEIILLICITFLKNGGTSLVSESTFPGYETSTLIVGGKTIKVPLINLTNSVENYKNAVNSDVKVAFLCNPHNPTGSIICIEEIKEFISEMNKSNIIPIIDEAYIQFADEKENSALDYIREGGRAVILRTFSKAYGLAGLRIGFAIGSVELIEKIQQSAMALPFRVNRLAQQMASSALDLGSVEKDIKKVKKLIKDIMNKFTIMGIPFVPSYTNYICFKPRNGSEHFLKIASESGVGVRDCTVFGLSNWIRASIKSQEDLGILLEVISKDQDFYDGMY